MSNSSSSRKKTTVGVANKWPQTSPSFEPSSVPAKKNEKLAALVSPHLDSFNYMTDEGLMNAVQSIPPLTIKLENQPSMTLWIEKAEFLYPTVRGLNGKEKPLYPSECRQRGISYVAPLHVTLRQSFNDSSQSQAIERVVGDVPVMVRSNRCRLYNASPATLVRRGEEGNEMGGYFICNGNERCVRLLQMPRRHHMMAIQRSSFVKRGSLYSEKAVMMRCVRRDQSAVTLTMHYLVDGNATIRIGIQKQEYLIPTVLLLKAISPLTDREIFERVLRGDSDNTYLCARIELILRESKAYGVYTREEALAYLGKHFRQALPYLSDDMSNIDVGNRLIDQYVFVHVEDSTEVGRAQKSELMMLMLRKLYAFAKGDICQDNPDSVMCHELLLPGHLYLMMLKEKLYDSLMSIKYGLMKEIKIASKTPSSTTPSVSDKSLILKVWERTPGIGHAMTYFLNTGNLRTTSGLDLMQLAGYTIVAEKLNFYRYFSHFRSVHRGQFFTTMKTTAVRKLLPDSWGFMCPVHTPDGSPCGLLNHLAVQCQVISYPPWKAETAASQEAALTRFLTNFGLVPSTGYSDGAMSLPHTYLPVMLNGKVLGGVPTDLAPTLLQVIRKMKVNSNEEERATAGVLPTLEACLILPVPCGPFPGLYLSTDAARMMRPVKQYTPERLVEMVGPLEQVFMDIACQPADVVSATTHIEIDPTNMLSLVASLTPFSDYNQSPRNMYQCQMAKQTMGTPCHSIPCRTDNKMYRIQTPQSPIVQNQRLKDYQLDEYPLGTNAVVAVISYTGYDMEDAMILNRSSYNRGFAHASVYKQLWVDCTPEAMGAASSKYFFSNIKTPATGGASTEFFTDALDRDGLPPIGKVVNPGDVIACYVNESTGEPEFVKHKESEPAIIDQINVIGNDKTGITASRMIQKVGIKLRFKRNPVVGDKFSSRHGQKGVMSILWPQEDMPFTESGMSPDIIINPHAFPSRMTIGMLIESMAAKTGAIQGTYQDSTPFQYSEENRVIDHFGSQLRDAGYNYMGSEPLYSGLTGTVLHADIYIGVVYYQRLRHMVSDKSQVRATGPTNALTRQPVKGRKKKGGIRFGEMERDALLAHGAAFLLQDRLLNCSDKHIAVVCTKCGSLLSTRAQRAVVASAGQSMMGAYQQAKQEWMCAVCDTGSGCEAVVMPYVFRYLVNELAAMNIKLKLDIKGC